MALDGIAVSCLVHELSAALCNGRIDKIYQPEPDEIILSVRGHKGNHKLLLTANASHPRLHLTAKQKHNPMQPPLFCMVMRKHLSGGKIISIAQPDFERVVHIQIESLNEMGDLSAKTLTIEIMGKHSNIILTDENSRIVDSVKRVSYERSSVREVLPGRTYVAAPSQNKMNPLTLSRPAFLDAIARNKAIKAQNAIYQSYTGISPAAAAEILYRANVAATGFAGELSEAEQTAVYDAFAALMNDMQIARFTREIVFDAQGKPIEFAPFALSMYETYNKKSFDTLSALIEFFYGERDTTSRMSQKSQDLRKLVQLNIERCVKKEDVFAKTIREIEGRDKWRLYGDLLSACLYQIKPGAESVTTANFYDENAAEITIPLQTNRTPSENMQAYFKRYNKEKRTYEALQPQIASNRDELHYLESVLSAIQSCTEETDVDDIREELTDQGFLRRRKVGKGKQKPNKSKPLRFVSSDGWEIFVGKNNKQNDDLTLRFADSDDLWLHAKDIPGSHVIIRTNQQTPPDQTITEAANLAAYYSKARASSLIPVDYTSRRHVKKPSGAKPGMVIYDTNRTAYITPDMLLINGFLNDMQDER